MQKEIKEAGTYQVMSGGFMQDEHTALHSGLSETKRLRNGFIYCPSMSQKETTFLILTQNSWEV